MKQFLLYGHGGAYNHGAEAIVKSTVKLLKKEFPDCKIILSTHFMEQDLEFHLPVDQYCVRDMRYLNSAISQKNERIYKSTLDSITSDTICLSIGGDNYCYDNWHRWKDIHKIALDRGAYTVLWGCSIDPERINEDMTAVLNSHHLITIRESLTGKALWNKGLRNISLCADPAFLLKRTPCRVPEQFIPGNTVALNISPLIMRREKQPGIVLENIYRLIHTIIAQTNMNLVLIPHVLMPMDNDLLPLREIYRNISDKNRIGIIDRNLSAAAYKYIISQCRFGIFARTHASIAAYSSLVPTMVLGYSVKAQGIAEDLGLSNYVLPVERINNSASVLEMFQSMQRHEADIHNILVEKMSIYKKKAYISLKSMMEVAGWNN